MKIIKILINFTIIILMVNLTACGGFLNPDWSKVAEPDGKKRARENVKQGKGLIIDTDFGKRGGTNFMFASSNPMWRASLETIDFMSLASVDYAGGLIISDWYSEDNPNEAVKITITFLSNEVRADGLKIDIRKRNCKQYNQCTVEKINNDLNKKIKDKILRKAAIYQKELKEAKSKNRPKKVYKDDNE